MPSLCNALIISVTETLLQKIAYTCHGASQSCAPNPLVGQAECGLDGRLTLVAAPAGFGKTTLVVDWRRQLPEAGS